MFPLALLLSCLLCSPLLSAARDNILAGEALSGNQTLISRGGFFEMGFFTPGTSGKYYIGIWYKDLPSKTVVWVANREHPVSDPFLSQFKILQDGSSVILDSSKKAIWSTDSTQRVSNHTYGVLLDGGNFVIRGISYPSDVVWQSFDHPADTWLPGAKFGCSKRSNDTAKFVAWRHPDDPTPGSFSAVFICNNGGKILYELRNGSEVYWNSREWTREFSNTQPTPSIEIELSSVLNDKEFYVQYSVYAPFNITRHVIDHTGKLQLLVWLKNLRRWKLIWQQPSPECEIVAFCGVLGSCKRHVPICDSHSQVPFCSGKMEDNFLVVPQIGVIPQYYDYFFVAESIDMCRTLCLSNCSCAAFMYGGVCYLWTSEKFKVELVGDDDLPGNNLYIRSLKGIETKTSHSKGSKLIALGYSLPGLVVVGLIMGAAILRRRYTRLSTFIVDDNSLTVFNYQHLSKYTKKFTTKIGEGGFGCVYRGNISGSNAIAVKRLKCVNQTEKQFLAEVKTIGSTHHINLVRLCGFCASGSNRFLVYDYMPNGSLASYLFQNGSILLDWEARYQIAIGIAKGLAYLHEECRDCIIHCDIKPENVLLDSDLVPKIADFGQAKLVGRDFSRVLTTVRGTRGYLAPEWISGEAITSKVDVFSYGKLLFEIISGKRNIDMPSDGDMICYFPIRVFDKIRKNGCEDLLTLLDYGMENAALVERACRVACWCIQDNEKNRPTMSQVVQMLEGVIEVASNPPMPRFYQQLLDSRENHTFSDRRKLELEFEDPFAAIDEDIEDEEI